MKTEITGITRANEGMQGISWNILGQTYVPKNCTEHSFSWHATLPPGSFVPPHIHPDQDEYLYMLEGKLDFMLGGSDAQATAGDLIRLGMGVPHGIFNKSDQTAKVLFWVSPTKKLYDLFWGLHNMKEQKPEDVVAMAAEYNIHFLPPPPGACGFLRALPGDRAFLPPSDARAFQPIATLTPASGRQDHTTSPYASHAVRLRAVCVHRSPRPTSVTVAIRPSCGHGIAELCR